MASPAGKTNHRGLGLITSLHKRTFTFYKKKQIKMASVFNQSLKQSVKCVRFQVNAGPILTQDLCDTVFT